jgi:hypothetical protein
MSWYALTHGFLESGERTNIWTPVRLAPQSLQPPRPARSLGTATAAARWQWASPNAGPVATAIVDRDDDDYDDECDDIDREPVATSLLVARDLRSEMAEMAHALGRSEDDIWAEAAREWLVRRLRNDEPPPTTPAAAPVPNVRTSRMWSEIDAMLAELRHPRYVAAPVAPAVPAA